MTTSAAGGIGTSGATLNGTVNANGDTTVPFFELGLDMGYGSIAAATPNPVSGSSDTPVSANVSDLLPNTTYHFRAGGTNSTGTANGADQTFTTLPVPPAAATTGATAVTATSATLDGSVNANYSTTTVSFEYGTSTSYGSTVAADQSPVTGSSATPVSSAVTGLTTGATYHYRVVAVNAGGTTYGADMTFVPGTAPPQAVTTAATGVGSTGATLNGSVNANLSTTSVTFEYGTSTAYDRTVPAFPGTVDGSSDTAVTLAITDLTPDTTYHFRVVASSTGGVAFGGDMYFTTGPGPAVTTEAATGLGTNAATLNGSVNAHSDSTTVTFEYGLTTAYGTTLTATQSPVTGSADTAVTATLSQLSPSTTYHYRAVGQSSSGTTYGGDMIFITAEAAPLAPTAVTQIATGVGPTAATLNGTVESMNVSTTVTFEYGLTTAYGTAVAATQSPVTSPFLSGVSRGLTGLTSGVTYHYRVVAQNAYGIAYGADQTFFTATPVLTAVTEPASGVTSTSATLNATINPAGAFVSIEFQYGLTTGYGSTVQGLPGLAAGTTDTPVTALLSGLISGIPYHYRVALRDAFPPRNVLAFGADEMFMTTAPPAVVTGPTSGVGATAATFNGTVNSNGGSTTVIFDYGLSTSYGKVALAAPSPVSGTTNTPVSGLADDLSPNTTYHYRLVGTKNAETFLGADQTFTTPGVPPTATTTAATGITTTGATLNGEVNARFDSTTVTFQYGTTTGYGSVATASQSPVGGGSTTPVSVALSGLTTGTYHYRVVAQNSSGTTFGADMTFNTGGTAPTVTTSPPTGVSGTGATLRGVVNGNGLSTTVSFELTPAGGVTRVFSADQSPVSGGADTAVSVVITGLVPDTTYMYRTVGTNGAGTTYGAEIGFVTSGPPTATTLAATAVGLTAATLNGIVNANSNSTAVTFEFGTDTGYGTTVLAGPSPVTGGADTSVSATITGLQPNTTYHFRVVGESGAGTTDGGDLTFVTRSGPDVTTLAATAVGVNTATLNGLVDANREDALVTFEYGTDIAHLTAVTADPSPVTGDSPTAVSVVLTGLQPGRTYHYRVVGSNAAGTAQGADMTFSTESVLAIPVLGGFGILMLAGLLAAAGLLLLRRATSGG